jgi:hypothetical protein
MIGFSIEFKRWYFVLRGPKGRVYLATGFAKRMPVMTPIGTYTLDQCIGTWPGDEIDEELLDTLRSTLKNLNSLTHRPGHDVKLPI